MATVANLEFRVGETWRIDATMHDSCNNILPIDGATVTWALAFNGTVIKTLTIGDGIVVVGDPANGECIITLTPAQQLALGIEATFYSHECQVVLADGTVTDQFAGTLQAKASLFPA